MTKEVSRIVAGVSTILGTPSPVAVPDPNSYLPVYMPQETIILTAAGGIQGFVASVPQCLAFESLNDLVLVLQSLGYFYTAGFAYVPFSPANGTFSGGPGDGLVPWIGMSPLPFSLNNPPEAADGAFVVNAGKYANFWNHGVSPFIGSSYHVDLIKDIQMRMDAARNGNPNLG